MSGRFVLNASGNQFLVNSKAGNVGHGVSP